MKKPILFVILTITFSFLSFSFLYSQIAVTPSATPAAMVANLVGPGITYSNVTYTGPAAGSGTFTNGNTTNLGMTSGVVLTTGGAALIPANNSGAEGLDNTGGSIPELNAIASATTYDGVILEFDFIPYSNNLSVRYIFGSEEYLEWVNSGFNDAFAFFISGPGIPGQQNLATVAGLPVTINNINTGTNSAFFVNNTGSGSGATTIEYDGFTTVLTASRVLIPCSTYHIRLMIADGGDGVYDSGVFIEENGFFSSGAITTVAIQPAYGFGSAVEGCAGSNFVFTMPNALPTNATFNYTVGGTATPGVDYVPLASSVTIPAGQTTYNLPINVLTDAIAEGNETITLTVQVSPCSTQTFTMNVSDPIPLVVNSTSASFCQGAGPVNISASSTGGNGIITYAWNNGAGNGTPVSVNPAGTTTYTVTGTDQCGRTNTSTSTVTVTPLPTSTFTVTSPICQGNASTVTYTGNAPAGATYNWNFAGGSASPGGTSQGAHTVTYGASGTYNLGLTVTSGGCTSAPSAQSVVVNPTPAIPAISSNSPVCSGGTLNLTANTIAGATYAWTGPSGYTANVEDPSRPAATVAMSGTYNLYVIVNGCTSATASTVVTVNPMPAGPAISSNTPVCQNGSLNLTSNTIAGATYVWSGPAFSSALEDPIRTPATVAMSGTYSAYVVVAGCTSATSTTPVVVNPLPATPVIASNTPVCTGNPITLTSNTIAATYNWSGPNGFTSSVEDPTIASSTVAMAGTYSLYMTALGCTSATANTNVVVNATPATPVIASNTPVCSGNPINLTSNTIAATYNWSGPNGFTSSVEDPTIAASTVAMGGNYTLYMSALGCTSATATTNVIVNATPATPVIASNTPVCSGNPINLTSNTIAATYNWTGPNGFTSSVEDPTIATSTVAMAGTYSLYMTAVGCTSATANTNVVVNATPVTPVIASNTPVCSGNPINLTSNTIAATYNWSGPNGFTSSVEDPTIAASTVAMGGNYTLYLSALGCTSATATTNVVVNATPATPVIASNTPVCSGNPINLTSNTIAATYNWSGPNGFTSSVEDPTIAASTVAMAGTYSLYMTALGCTSATANTNVVVNATPATPVIASNTPVCSGNPINLTSNTIAATYNWSGPNGFTSSVEDPTIAASTVAMGGNYTLYMSALGCTSATATTNVIVNATPATPVIASNTPVCSGNPINLTSNTIAATYNWTGPNGFTSSVEDPTIAASTVAMGGNYTLYLSALGCTSATATTNVVVNATPATPVIASNTPVCSGNPINLTSNTIAATYNWSGPNGFTSSVEDPTIAASTVAMGGNYTLYLTAVGCTSATATTNVVVNATPATPVIASNTPVCSGNPINLTSNTIAATYNWTGPNGFTSSVEDPTIASSTVAMAGTYNLYLSALGCTSATANTNVIVNQTPALPTIASNTPICTGNAINLTANTIAGATYSWTGPNGFTSATEDPTINGSTLAMGGTYNLYVTVSNCSSATAATAVVVNSTPATPTISSNTPVCTGNSINLTSNTIAGAVYNWSGPNGFTSSQEDPSIANSTLAMAGSYSLYLTATGCTSTTANTNVVVNQTPALPTVASNTPVCAGNPLNLTSNTVAGATYAWSGPNGFTSNVEDPSIAISTVPATGNYSLYVTVAGCSSSTASLNAVVNPIPASPVIGSNTPICQNGTINFTANTISGATYAWSGSNAFTSALEDPSIANAAVNASGTYSAYVIVLGCTSATSNTAVVVNPTPTAPVIASNTPVCAGSALNLTSNTIAGASYFWSGPNAFSSNVEDPSIANASVAASGSYSAYVVVSGCTSAVSNHSAVINPIPATPTIASNTPVCETGSINLTANTTPGATYVWSGPNAFTSSAEDPTIASATVANAGNYNAYIVVLGCTSATATTPVAVNLIPASPVIASNSPICEGGNIALTANTVNGASYFWSGPNAFTSNVEDPSLSPATMAMGGSYSAYIVVAGCTSSTANTAVVVNPTPALPVIASNGPLCLTEVLNLTANTVAGATYNWTGPNAYTSNVEDPSFAANNLNMAGTYSLYLSMAGCTSATASTNVQIGNMPVADFALSSQVCLGSSAFALYSGSSPASSTYTWVAPGGTTSGTGQGPINITWNTAGTQNVTLTVTENGCPSLPVTHSVEVIAPVIPDAGPDQTFCSGSFVNVGSQNLSGATFTWITPNGIADVNQAYTTASWANNTNTEMTVTITLQSDNQGCLATDNAVMTIVPIPVASFVAPVAQCFSNNNFSFTAGGTYMPTASFDWDFTNASIATSANQNPSGISFSTTGTNDVTLTVTQNGCVSAPFTLPITINQGPQAAFNQQIIAGCIPMLVNFTDASTSTAGGMTYSWNFGDGNSSTIASPSNTYTQEGSYSVSLTVLDNTGCSSTVVKNNIVNVHPNPVAGFYAHPEIIYINEPYTNINDASTGNVTTWDYVISGSNQHFSTQNFTATFTDTGSYTITQTVTNEYGCADVFVLDIHVRPVTEIFIPNAFTPTNNDDLNATFKPSGMNFDGYKMYIFNRWGEMLFSTADIDQGWDGRVRNSDVEAKQDLYVYKILYNDHLGNQKEILGNVMVLR